MGWLCVRLFFFFISNHQIIIKIAIFIYLFIDGWMDGCISFQLNKAYQLMLIKTVFNFRTLPNSCMEKIVETISKYNIQSLLVIGGFEVPTMIFVFIRGPEHLFRRCFLECKISVSYNKIYTHFSIKENIQAIFQCIFGL